MWFCGGASVIVLALTALSLVALLSARSADDMVERVSAFAISLLALAVSFAILWSLVGGLAALGPSAVQFEQLAERLLAAAGVPVALFQIQGSVAAIIFAYLAWRFPGRE